ncbi:hypothetical protein CEXT_399761 [Caerostris extrusa]|uniref:Uncharacterized protein n=1 Tax=Caerostris extrusa TaxID=172846 RepID=A0AAV4XB22_CAEEX|nr:hypothetical protein CEXT_399761 [Caerostris extrusa]
MFLSYRSFRSGQRQRSTPRSQCPSGEFHTASHVPFHRVVMNANLTSIKRTLLQRWKGRWPRAGSSSGLCFRVVGGCAERDWRLKSYQETKHPRSHHCILFFFITGRVHF